MVIAKDLAERKALPLAKSDAIAVMAGGTGTLDRGRRRRGTRLPRGGDIGGCRRGHLRAVMRAWALWLHM